MRALILSEDGSKEAHDTLEALVRKMLQIVDPSCQTHKVHFEPAPDNLKIIVRGNRWKSTRAADHREIVALRRQLATKLASDPPEFVLFHIDGDRTWTNRDQSENRAKFRERIEKHVRDVIEASRPDLDPDRCMARLLLLVPYYSIEAWVYQNTARARSLCQQHHQGKDVERFDAWERDRAQLDEVEKIKDTTCLGSKHNRELARNAFPHEAAYGANTSFAAAVVALLDCDDLCQAVSATWQAQELPPRS